MKRQPTSLLKSNQGYFVNVHCLKGISYLPPSVSCNFAQLRPGAVPNVYSHIWQRPWILNNVSLHKGTEKTTPLRQVERAVCAGNVSVILGGNLKLGGLLSHWSSSFSRSNMKRDLEVFRERSVLLCSRPPCLWSFSLPPKSCVISEICKEGVRIILKEKYLHEKGVIQIRKKMIKTKLTPEKQQKCILME